MIAIASASASCRSREVGKGSPTLEEASGFVVSAREDQRVLELKVEVGTVAFAQPAKEREESLQFGVPEPAMNDLLGADRFNDVNNNLEIEIRPWLVAPLQILGTHGERHRCSHKVHLANPVGDLGW